MTGPGRTGPPLADGARPRAAVVGAAALRGGTTLFAGALIARVLGCGRPVGGLPRVAGAPPLACRFRRLLGRDAVAVAADVVLKGLTGLTGPPVPFFPGPPEIAGNFLGWSTASFASSPSSSRFFLFRVFVFRFAIAALWRVAALLIDLEGKSFGTGKLDVDVDVVSFGKPDVVAVAFAGAKRDMFALSKDWDKRAIK